MKTKFGGRRDKLTLDASELFHHCRTRTWNVVSLAPPITDITPLDTSPARNLSRSLLRTRYCYVTASGSVHFTQANITPEVVVLAPDGKRLYQGRIDDRNIDFGKARYAATTHDLRDALDAILQGKPVPHPTTQAIGCFIPEVASH